MGLKGYGYGYTRNLWREQILKLDQTVSQESCCSIMARKKAQRKQETTLVPHRTPNLSGLLERAKSGNSAHAVKAYLDAGGLPTALTDAQGAAALLTVPIL
jgi:hypothetical protein